MAVIKAVSSKSRIEQALDYVMKKEKTEDKLVSGLNCDPKNVKNQMQVTKLLWGKTGGRTYKHFVQSFHKDENITPEQAHEIAKEFAEQCPQFKGFEVLIATHKDREHIHTHFVVNSVNYEDGRKFRMHKSELQQMKDLSDQMCRQRGLYICKKGKTFSGEEREETVAWSKDTYQLLKKAEQGEIKSYVQDIALAVLDCKEQAISREDFINRMEQRGYKTDWQDNHKYITWTDLAREKAGEKACKIRDNKLEKYYNMPFGKGELTHEFEANSRREAEREQTRERARLQLDRTADTEDRTVTAESQNMAGQGEGSRAGQPNIADRAREQLRQGQNHRKADSKDKGTDRGTGKIDTGEILERAAATVSNSKVRVSSGESDRAEREAERSRQHTARERRTKEEKCINRGREAIRRERGFIR